MPNITNYFILHRNIKSFIHCDEKKRTQYYYFGNKLECLKS